MLSTVTRFNKWPIRAFTLLDSLLVLFLVTSLVISLAGSVHQTFGRIEEELFFYRFEQLYLDSQKMSWARQERLPLTAQGQAISNPYASLELPSQVRLVAGVELTFSPAGGNSSLAKIQFLTSRELVTYQLYLGSGKYKKTSQSLYSP